MKPTAAPARSTATVGTGTTAPVVFRLPVRVYWEDTDAGGIVFYANYLKYFERARTEWLRACGVAQQALRETAGLIFVVTEARLRYRAPARLDDALDVSVALGHQGTASLWILQQVHCGSRLLVDGEVRVGCVADGTFQPRRIPSDVAQRLACPPP